MQSNDEKREAIIIELNKRALTEGTTQKYFEELIPAMVQSYADARGDAVKLMGLAQALLRHTMTVFYGTATTPVDLQVRTAEDVSAMAGSVWNECCRNAEMFIDQVVKSGVEVPDDLLAKVKAMPSDASKRPDMVPCDPLAGRIGRPSSVADLMSLLNQPKREEVKASEAPVETPVNAVVPPKVSLWSVGSTMGGLGGVGNGKGN